MKRLMIGLLGACACAAVALAAEVPAQDAPAREPSAQESPAQEARANQATAESSPRRSVDDRICLRETGTRIQRRDSKDQCVNANGRSYTRDDLDRTGDVNLADALRRLDPAIR